MENEDPMENHYNNPALNAFQDDDAAKGLNIEDLKSNCELYLLLPSGIKENGIRNLMKNFGKVTRVHISAREMKNKVEAFVGFSTFTETQKAFHELRNPKNTGLNIHVEFARTRKSIPERYAENEKTKDEVVAEKQPELAESVKTANSEPIEEKFPLIINFQSPVDDNIEKVSLFEYMEYKNILYEATAKKHCEEFKKLAKKSEGTYDKKKNCFRYNKNLYDQKFLTYYCQNCSEEANLKSNEHQYFCSKTCCEKKNNMSEEKDKSIKMRDKVSITAIINEKCIFVKRQEGDLNFLLEEIYRKSKLARPLEAIPEIGDVVLVKAYESMFRGKVLKYNNESLTVQLIDIGNTCCVKLENLFEIPSECSDMEVLVQKVYLKNVNLPAINYNVIFYLLDLLERETELIVKNIDDNGEFELMDNTTNIIVNHAIINLNNKLDIFPKSFAIGETFTVGLDKRLFVIDSLCLESKGLILCVDEKYLKDFYEFYKSLNAYAETLKKEDHGIYFNQFVMVKVNDQWYRAEGIEATGDGRPTCFLSDFRLYFKVPVENIYSLPLVFSEAPVFINPYKIDGYDPTNEAMRKYFASLIKENEFLRVDEIKTDNKGLLVKFTDVEKFH